MLAHYRSGRQADALSAYRKARRELSEGLGLEPGEEVRALEQAILRHDPSLDPPGGASPQPSRSFFGRDRHGERSEALERLRGVLGSDVTVIAPDGFSDFEALEEGAGPAAEGVVVSVPGVPAERLRGSGRRFVEDFEDAIGTEATPYSITAAQATQVLLDAIAASDGTRASVTHNLFRARVTNGILGDFEIDENGDTPAGGVTMYRIENGRPRVGEVITPPPSLVR